MNRLINKIKYTYVLSLKEETISPYDYILSLLILLFQSVIYYLLFRNIFTAESGTTSIAFTHYYLSVGLVAYSIVPAQFVAFSHMEDIHNGSLILSLVKPFSYTLKIFIRTFSAFSIRVLINSLFLVIIRWLLLREFSILNYCFFLFSIMLGFSILYFIQGIIGCCTIWIYDITRIRDVVYTVLLILGGRLIPSKYLFGPLSRFVYFTPIPYVYDIPTRILNEESPAYFRMLSGQMIWLMILMIIYMYLFKNHVSRNLENN